MKDFNKFKHQLLKNKKTKQAYDDLKPEYDLIEKLIGKRLEQGLTQRELAARVGTKQSAISRLESGSYNPTLSFLVKIAHGLKSELKLLLI